MVKLQYIHGGNATAVLKNGMDRVYIDVVNGECEVDEDVAERLLASTAYGTSFKGLAAKNSIKPEVIEE